MMPANIKQLDQQDSLATYREYFHLPKDTLYFCGHSLGPMPKSVPEHVNEIMQAQWGEKAIQAWNTADWISLPERVGNKIAPLIGAKPGEAIVSDSLSINLYKALICGLQLRPDRQ